MPDSWMLPVFIVNFCLIILDAAVGYRVAPSLFRNREIEPDDLPRLVKSVRNTLTMVVILYMFFNCLAYFRGNNSLAPLITGLVVIDLMVQGWMYRKGRNGSLPE